MRAVFRHELSSHFSNMSGYVFGAFLLLFAGIYTMVYNLSYRYPEFEYVYGDMSFAFLLIVPILTMRVVAEERRQKTDQLLYSLPLTMTKVVLGKYAALMVVFLMPISMTAMYAVGLTAFGSVHLFSAFGACIGFFLLGAALIAIGMFISSVTESQAVAAGLCFVVMLVNYYITSLASFVSDTASASLIAFSLLVLVAVVLIRVITKNTMASVVIGMVLETAVLAGYVLGGNSFAGLFPRVMTQLSLFERFYMFVNGVFDLTTVVYYLSVAGVFLVLSVQSLERRRWSE